MIEDLPLLLELLAVIFVEGVVVLLRELGQAELVVFRVAKVFLRKNFPLILHTVVGLLVFKLLARHVAGLYLVSLVLLLNDILLDAFID